MRQVADNVGGINAVWIADPSAFSLIGEFQVQALISQNMIDSMKPVPIYPFQTDFSETPSDSDQGTIYNKTLTSAVLPTDPLALALAPYQGRQVVMIYQDLDFFYWMACSKGEPLLFSSDFAIGKNPNEGKSMAISITGTNSHPKKLLTVISAS